MAMCDLPQKLVGEKILTRVPITSLKAVRSTCKTWDAITKNWVLGCKAARGTDEFLGFMTMNNKVYSVRFRRCEEDLVDVSVKQVDLLNHLEIDRVYHCDGLVLCVAKNNSMLVVWNPYLCETRSIGPRENFHSEDRYAIGYGYDKKEEKRNHKILRFVEDIGVGPERVFGYEIYEIRSNSWRVLDVNPEWEIDSHQRGVSVKGNTYFFAHEKFDDVELEPDGTIVEVEDFLLCFDFTKERFGPRLPLPFHSYSGDCVTLSSVRDEQLAVLFGSDVSDSGSDVSDSFEIWVTITVEPNYVSWSKFLQVETGPFPITGFKLDEISGGSFFVDEENNVAVVFELDGYLPLPTTKTARQHTAFVFGEDGYFKSVNLGEAPFVELRETVSGNLFKTWPPPLVCPSSYRPSLVQVKQPRRKKKKARHAY